MLFRLHAMPPFYYRKATVEILIILRSTPRIGLVYIDAKCNFLLKSIMIKKITITCFRAFFILDTDSFIISQRLEI